MMPLSYSILAMASPGRALWLDDRGAADAQWRTGVTFVTFGLSE